MLNVEIASAENVGKRVRWVREYNKLTQIQFSKILGHETSANLSNWEVGRQRLSIEGALLINQNFGTTLDFLYLGRVRGLESDMVAYLADHPVESIALPEVADSTRKSKDKPVK